MSEDRLLNLTIDELYEYDCFRLMNNLYLAIERGEVEMSLHFRLVLERLLVGANTLNEYWTEEFYKLPNWFAF